MITQEQIDLLKKALGNSRIQEHALFQFGTTDYEAELYTEAAAISELVEMIKAARTAAIDFHILGIGFFPKEEREITGLVIKNNCRKFAMLSMRGAVASGQTEREVAYVQAESGVSLNQLVRFTLDEGLGGLECFLGIQGTLGDNLLENTAAEERKGFLPELISTLQVLTKENEMMEAQAEPFLYPVDERMIGKKQVIPLSVVFKLTPSEKSELWKKATQAAFKRNQSDLLDPLKGNFNY